jgi:hypothetical protein
LLAERTVMELRIPIKEIHKHVETSYSISSVATESPTTSPDEFDAEQAAEEAPRDDFLH